MVGVLRGMGLRKVDDNVFGQQYFDRPSRMSNEKVKKWLGREIDLRVFS